MAFSWRFSVTLDDRSQKARPGNATGVAGTVVAGQKSLEKPVYFERGETQRMLNLLGAPTKVEQGILEAIEYNKSYPIWVVSPAKVLKRSYAMFVATAPTAYNFIGNTTEYGYMMSDIASDGSFTSGADLVLNSGETTGTPADRESFRIVKTGVIPSTTTLFKASLNNTATPVVVAPNASTFIVDGITFSIATDGDYYVITRTEGTLTNSDVLHLEFTRNTSNAILYLINRSVGQAVGMSMQTKVLTGTKKYVDASISITNYLNKTISSSVEFALEKDAKDGFGNPLNPETVFENNDYIEAIYNPAYDTDTVNTAYLSSSTITVTLPVYTRNDSLDGTDFAAGYDFFKKFNSYPVDLFFDATGESSVPSKLAELRGGDVPQYTSFQPFASVLLPLANVNTKADALAAIALLPQNRGFSVYTGRFKIRNDYSSKAPVFEGVPMGEVAKRTADSIVLSYGGLATAWIDESGVGGLLNGGRILGYAKNQTEYSETDLKELDEAKVNPIVYDYTNGPMIVSRRTTFADYSDYSFNDYSRIVDYCIKNILKNVFPYQVVKMNDEDHRAVVRMRTNAILEPLTVRPYAVLRNYAIKCDEENNNDSVLAREEFILEVAIKITPKSRTLKLIFINAPQTQSVEAMFED